MTTPEFVSHLRRLGVEIWEDGGSLRCNAPKTVLTSELEAAIRDRKSDIILYLNQANGSAYCSESSLQPLPRDGVIPLSFAQERLWILDQLQTNGAVYNESFALRLKGSLNLEALQKAFDVIVSRHEVLRTTFTTIDGVPAQVISVAVRSVLKIGDLRQMEASERDLKIQQIFKEETSRPFNLSSDLMLRPSLLRVGSEEHILLLVMHHIVTDGWSVGVFFRELTLLYEAFCKGRLSPLPQLPVQYADYAIWQRRRLQGEFLKEQLSYWKEQLKGAAQSVDLPTDRPRPAVLSYRGARQSFLLPTSLTTAIKALSRRQGVTLFMTLLAAFKVLLHRYSRQDDIVVGSPIAGRTGIQTEGLIGFFVNNLVLRTDVSGDPSFTELLRRVREVAIGAYEHQDMPFEKLVEELQPQRDMSRNPLFQLMFSFMVADKQIIELPGLSLSPVEVSTGLARFDLFLSMSTISDSLTGMLEYNSDLFEDATIRRMLGHFQTVLEDIAVNPERRIGDLSFLTEPEWRQLLTEWNETRRDYPRDKCIHELFEEQAERTPDAVAVVFESQQLTYGELHVCANQLAHELRNRDVRAGALVGIFMERSIEMVIALLGILKAGGAYVPLDPTYPSERLSFMVEDAGLTVLVTQPELIDKLPAHQARVTVLTTDWSQFCDESQENPTLNTDAINLAYVIYTSGSTGKPKGVEITHGSVVNFLTSMRERPGMTSQDTLLAVTTLSFDIAGLELYLPLLVGGRVVIASREVAFDGARLSQHITEFQPTVMQATPATWRLLLESGWQGNKQLKILCGGEALPRALADQLLERSASLWNMYGPTETTIWSTVHQVSSGEGTVLVGRPIANTRIYILDRYMQPAPIGVPGELCIGGAGVARGYLNRPELTEEKFISDPFSEEPRARIYRTGDLARYLADGNIELLGRIDHQVKVRGFRIELGEIETVLAEHPEVRQAAVHLWKVKANDVRIVACCVPAKTGGFSPISLRKHLRARLPEYMVPQDFLPVEELPLTPNGKIDRSKLPTPVFTGDRFHPHEAPSDPIEATIAEIWTNLIGPARSISRADKFFEMGGHSLLGLQALRQMEHKLGVALDFRVLFQESLADIAVRCRSERVLGGGGTQETPLASR